MTHGFTMNIDFEKACVAMKRKSELAKDECSTKIIAEFLYNKCHYFTLIACEYLRAESVTIFYLSNSGRIVHSAIAVDKNMVLDVLGRRTSSEIKSAYDAMNSVTGLFHTEGHCVSRTLPIASINLDSLYTEPLIDLSEVRQKATDWLKRIV